MSTIVRLPKLGLSDWGEIVEWRVESGDTVEAGEVIAELESDKSVVDIEAPTAGVFLTSYVEAGEELPIEPGRPIAAIGEEGESAPSPDEVHEQEPAESGDDTGAEPVTSAPAPGEGDEDDVTNGEDEAEKVTPRASNLAEDRGIDPAAVPGTGPDGAVTADDVQAYASRTDDGGEVTDGARQDGEQTRDERQPEPKATPKAKRFASEHSVDLAEATGTGPAGAITEADVEALLSDTGVADDESAETPVEAESGTAGPSGETTVSDVRELSALQRTVADRLTQSSQEKPHVRGDLAISIERLLDLSDDLAAGDDVVSVNDLLLRAVALTLQDHPEFNAVYEDGEYKLIEEINLGYAVDTDRGLIVPVVPDAASRSVTDLAEARGALVERVLDGTHEPSDLQGGTFTVTNVGALGMDASFSIINPPEVAILAVGRRSPELFERDGEYVPELAITFSLMVDHRVLDGGDAGAFLTTLQKYVEHPSLLLEA